MFQIPELPVRNSVDINNYKSKVYPNLIRGLLKIELIDREADYTLHNLLGIIIKAGHIFYQIELNLLEVQKEFYFLIIDYEGVTYNKKLVVI